MSRQMITMLVSLGLMVSLTVSTAAQNLTQTVRGQVTDAQTKRPLKGANVVVVSTKTPTGTTTDEQGNFEITEIPVGRHTIKISYMGYSQRTMSNVEVKSGSQTVLNIKMQQRVIEEEAVEVTAENDKMETNNEMAAVSTRSFTIDESQRYAGSRNDVARMASNFAGVQGSDGSRNDIVIRGNSPLGMLWRLEGVAIPNPNHFGGFGSTGGPVSMLNNNTLAQSDFSTGAFPAQYGDAYAGVFDLQMRRGNNQEHEFLGQVGFNGFEAGLEGPIDKEKGSSYMVNYRYSTLSVFQQLGVDIGTGSAVPKYQDVNFKLHFPDADGGHLQVFGLGGINRIKFSSGSGSNNNPNLYTNNKLEVTDQNRLGILGVEKQWLLGDETVATLTLAGTHQNNTQQRDSTLNPDTDRQRTLYGQRFRRNKLFGSIKVDHRFNSQHSLEAGLKANHYRLDMVDSNYQHSTQSYRRFTDFDGNTSLIQPYMAYQFKASQDLTLNAGLHGNWLTLDNQFALEPRISAEYQDGRNTYTAGFGLHSQKAPLNVHFQNVRGGNGKLRQANKDLGFIKALHGVLGYERQLSEKVRLKTEAYYQDITQSIVEPTPSSYSILNFTDAGYQDRSPRNLVNGGSGTNYGLDVTLEQFMDQGFYYMLTSSIFTSQYEGSDGKQRSTAHNGNCMNNLVIGKEFELWANSGDQSTKTFLVLDGSIAHGGGKRYTPIDVQASREQGETVYQLDKPYTKQFKDYFRSDLQLSLKVNGENVTQEFGFDIQNITDRKNPLRRNFNPSSGTVETINQTGILPVGQYRVEF